MRVYHERLRVPASWWVLGLTAIVILGTEPAAGLGWLAAAGIYLVLVGGYTAMLLSWGRATIEVADGALRAGKSRTPLAAISEATALDEAQTRALRGPRADPAAFLLVRPYLRRGVFVRLREPGAGAPYWLLGSRRAPELAAAIESARAGSRADDPVVG